jgi:hypothetical protein
MINWYLVVLGPLGAIVGTEIARRRMAAAGNIYSFQPVWMNRVLVGAGTFALMLFLEAARAALADPTPFHLWTLILSAGAAHLALAVSLAKEVQCAKSSMLKGSAPAS